MAKPAFPDSSYAGSECTDKKSLQQSNLIHEPVTDQLITDLKTPLSGWELAKVPSPYQGCHSLFLIEMRMRSRTIIFHTLSVFLFTSVGLPQGLWTPIGPEGGTVRVLAVDPTNTSTLYIGTETGGVFKSTDGGANWSVTCPHERVHFLS